MSTAKMIQRGRIVRGMRVSKAQILFDCTYWVDGWMEIEKIR
jgi:hypothetical protein